MKEYFNLINPDLFKKTPHTNNTFSYEKYNYREYLDKYVDDTYEHAQYVDTGNDMLDIGIEGITVVLKYS